MEEIIFCRFYPFPYFSPVTLSARYDEVAFLQKIALGDEQTFTELFHYWQSFLSTHIYRITESKELTEEIVQDVFLKIWQARETLTEIRSFKAYLLVVSKNHALNAIQKISREFSNWEKWARENPGAEEVADNRETYYSLIDEAVDHLSARQKEVYLLHRHQRLTYAQIAEQLGIGRETVKTHIEMAVKHISSYVKGRLGIAIILLLLQG